MVVKKSFPVFSLWKDLTVAALYKNIEHQFSVFSKNEL